MNTLTDTPTEHITLYYREGNSDKVYHAAIEPAGELYAVHFAYGRRGSTLATGTKTNAPVDYDQAKRIMDKLVREKKAKGYTPGDDGTPYRQSGNESRATGILPQLLNPIDEAQVQHYIDDPAYCMQEKFDGRRVLIQKSGEECTGINRKGLTIGLPSTLVESTRNIAGDFVLDGECIGDDFHAFDILALNGEDLRPLGYAKRWQSLCQLINSNRPEHIHWVDTAFSPASKRETFDYLRAVKAEGVVFKRTLSPYTPGRPASGGDQLKHKFYATLSAVVTKINAQRSVELKLLNKDGWQTAGNVTIPANRPIPAVGVVVEARYLYAHRESGCLYQPTYLGIRSDIGVEECMASQLKFKSTEEEN